MSSAEEKQRPQLRAVAAEQELCVGPFIPAHALLAMRPPAPLVSGVLAMGHVGAIVGEYGAGKTFVGLDLAAAVAMGRRWLGADTRQGAVAIIEADSPGNSLVPRLLALESRYPGTILLRPQEVSTGGIFDPWVLKEAHHPLGLLRAK